MGSRLRHNPKKIFEFFAEVARPDDIDSQEPFILQTYPVEVDEELKKSVPKFAFPCNFENPAVDHFTFTFTDIDGNYTFGFCRHNAGAHTCLCIISFLPWYEIFYKLLNKVGEILNKSEGNDPTSLLASLFEKEMPDPGDEVCVISKDYNSEFSFVCPDPYKLPCIPENRNLTEYYNAVDASNMMNIFASMLYERRILVTSRKLSRMTACVHGCASLIYPMFWQHLYIPVLPASLVDYVSAPMPFLIGIHSTLLEKARKMDLGDVVILDADKNTVESEYDDLDTLPSDVVSSLKKKLKHQQTDRVQTTMLSGDGVARAFLRTLVNLIGGYRDALKFREGESIIFDEEAFINSRPSSTRPFLEKMLHLQIFHQFIEERLDLLNSGEGFSDIFEEETTLMAGKGSSSKYKEWMGNMMKQGKKFTLKANPVIRSTFETVKHKGKKAMKDLKTKIEELRRDEEMPTTVIGAQLKAERPPRPPLPGQRSVTMRPHSGTRRRSSYEKARRYKPIEFDDVHAASSDDDFKHTSVGLLDDPDIQNALRKSWSCQDIGDVNNSDEDELFGGSTENVGSSLLVPSPKHSIRKNVSDTALDERQHQTTEVIPPIAPPRRKRGNCNDAPLITLSSIAPDISGSDSERSASDNEAQMFNQQQLSENSSASAWSKLPEQDIRGNADSLERNRVRQLSQMFNHDITKRIAEQKTGKISQPCHVTKLPEVTVNTLKDETVSGSNADTIERNKVKHLSQMFHQDITKHIVEQQTGKLYEPAYRSLENKPKISRHEAFRDSNRPVPSRRPSKAKKTEQIIQQLTGHAQSSETRPSAVDGVASGETLSSETRSSAVDGIASGEVHDSTNTDVLFDPFGLNTSSSNRETKSDEESLVLSKTVLGMSEQSPDGAQLSPNTNLLKEWELNFDLSSANQASVTPMGDQSANASGSDASLAASQTLAANALKIHVRGPYGSGGYEANPKFMEVTTYANQSNYASTPPTSVANAMWTQKRTSPNYSAIFTSDLMSPGVFGSLDKRQPNLNQRQNCPSPLTVQKPVTSAPMQPGFYSGNAPNSVPNFEQSSRPTANSSVLRPQQAKPTTSDPFADLDPLKSMVQTKSQQKWETFQ